MGDDITLPDTGEGARAAGGFAPITSQEDFDKAIKSRLERAERQFEARHKDVFEKARLYDERAGEAQTALDDAVRRAEKAEADLAEATRREEVESWKRDVTRETGVPADILRGETREELMAHAESIKAHGIGKPVVSSDGFAVSGATPKATRDQFAESISTFLGE